MKRVWGNTRRRGGIRESNSARGCRWPGEVKAVESIKWCKFPWQKVEPWECLRYVWDSKKHQNRKENTMAQVILNLEIDEILRAFTTGAGLTHQTSVGL